MFFSNQNHMSEGQQKAYLKKLNKKKIRLFHYPFDSIISILSDIDFSTTIDHKKYSDIFVKKFGLDFGDSVFLYSSMAEEWYKAKRIKKSMSLSEYNYKESDSEILNDYVGNSKYVLDELINSNTDHLHGLSDCGPSYFYIKNIRPNTKVIGQRFAHHNNFKKNGKGGVDMPIFKVWVSNTLLDKIIVNIRGNKFIFYPCLANKNLYEIDLQIYPHPPLLSQIENIYLVSNCLNVDIVDMILLNFNLEKILDLIKMYSEAGFQFPLMTDHASTIFMNSTSEKNNINKVRLASARYPLEWLHCRLCTSKIEFSVLGDSPESFFYIINSLKKYFKLRFVNPSGISGEKTPESFSIFEILSPSFMRNNDKIYTARRLLIRNDKEKKENISRKENRRTEGFIGVLEEVLNRDGKNKVFPIYTHLGYIEPEKRSEPYFSPIPFNTLHNRVYGKVKNIKRTWFVRGPTLYDYSLLISNIANHVTRFDNRIFIWKWKDKVLNTYLPIDQNQLHGITFYIEERKKVLIFLNFKKIENYVMNGPDDTGRKSITIIGEGKVYSALKNKQRVHVSNLEYFEKENGAFDIRLGAKFSSLKIELKDFNPFGSQYLKIIFSKDNKKLIFGVLVELETKESFYFGDRIKEIESCGEYIFDEYDLRDGVRIASFYDINWKKQGYGLPSHPVKQISIYVKGNVGDILSFGDINFIRPSTVTIPES